MRHFPTLTEDQGRRLFEQLPESFDRSSPRELMANALGATLYTPGTHPELADVVRRQGRAGVTSMVICLEDAIADTQVAGAHANLVRALSALRDEDGAVLPLVFVRLRTPHEIAQVREADLGDRLAGFVLPKFSPDNGDDWYTALETASDGRPYPLLGMPVLESAELVDPLLRPGWLHDVRAVIRRYPGRTLAVRIGATDIAGTVGLRRDVALTAYSIGPLRDAISAIVGILGTDRATVPAITGAVWEHFRASSRTFRPQLRSTVFHDRGADVVRDTLLDLGLDVLAEELALDRAHGLVGKTAIHPNQVPIINAWQAVPHEEHSDALAVLNGEGATASAYSTRMNEAKPHRAWADQVLLRGRAAGVLRRGVSWVDILLATGKAVGLSEAREAMSMRAT